MFQRLRRWWSKWPESVGEGESPRAALTAEEKAERERVLDRWYTRMKRAEGNGGSAR